MLKQIDLDCNFYIVMTNLSRKYMPSIAMKLRPEKYFIAVLCALLGLISCKSHAQKLTPLRLQLKWHNQFQFAGYHAAKIKGFYEKEGLSVTIIEGGKNISPIEVISTGKAEFGIFDPEILFKNPKGRPIVAISAILQTSAYGVLSKPKSNIRRPADLVGKRILVAGDQGWNIFKAIMLKEGIPIQNTSISERIKDSEELLSDSVDAVITYYTSQPPRLRQLGLDPAIMKPIDYGIDFYGDVIFASKEYADDNPEIVEAFNRANRKGWEYALSHKEEMADFLLKQPGVTTRNFTKKGLLEEANELEKLILPKFVEIGHMNTGRWQNMLSIYQELGLADKNLSLKGFLYEPLEAKKSQWYETLIYILIIGSLIFIAVVLWNRQLRHQVLSKTAALSQEIADKKMAEDRLSIAMEAAGLNLWEWNIKNNEVLFNERWVKLLGQPGITSPQTIKSWAELIHPDDKIKYTETIDQLINGEKPSSKLVYRVKTSTGSWRWLLSALKTTTLDEKGRPSKITGMHLDIDSIKKKEIELQETTKELLKTNKDLQQFASITSHNLRAPIVNLRSLTEMSAEGNLSVELEEEIKHKIYEVVKNLDGTLSDLVEIVSIKSGEKTASENLNFQLELVEIIAVLQHKITSSGALITSDFTEASTVYFPKKYMESILNNLISNSIAYCSEVNILKISLKSYINGSFTVLEITDNGCGINLERFKNKVFGLYQRFHTNDINHEGKGLGLFIVKSQMEAMDGKIEVESMLNQGTTFKIYFHNRSI